MSEEIILTIKSRDKEATHPKAAFLSSASLYLSYLPWGHKTIRHRPLCLFILRIGTKK